MTDAENSPSPSSLSKIEKIIGIVIALLTGWAAFQSTIVKDRLAVQGAAIDSSSNSRNISSGSLTSAYQHRRAQ